MKYCMLVAFLAVATYSMVYQSCQCLLQVSDYLTVMVRVVYHIHQLHAVHMYEDNYSQNFPLE